MIDGKCYCGLPLEGHPMCDGCHILLGEKHDFQPVPFRGKTLCRLCVKRWEKVDQRLGRPARFEEIMGVIPPGYRACPSCGAVVPKTDDACDECGRTFYAVGGRKRG